MKKSFLIGLVLILPQILCGQINLVPNPSFEDSIACNFTLGTFIPQIWYSPTFGSPDYYNISSIGNNGCSDFGPSTWGGGNYQNMRGYQLPQDGKSYIGFGASGFEYVAVRLIDTLEAGKKYSASFYVSLAEISGAGMDMINFCFRSDSITGYLQAYPFLDSMHIDAGNARGNCLTDTSNWILVTDTFVAQGGEMFMYFGDMDFGNELFCVVDSNLAQGSYYYFDNFDVHCIDCFTPSDTSSEIRPFLLYPNPSSGLFFLEYTVPSQTVLEIFDVLGQKIMSVGLSEDENKTPFNLTEFAAGIYVWRVRAGDEVLHTGKLVLSQE